MFLIFGTKGRITKSEINEILRSSCPNCSSDLELRSLRTWFTLFFIPVFPINIVDTFYQCQKCDSSYKASAKKALLGASANKEEVEKEVKRFFAKTLLACTTHMANVDGQISATEMEEIEKIKKSFNEFRLELDEVYDQVLNAPNPEDFVYALLRKSSEVLTSKAIMTIIGLSAKVLLADGRIDKEEERLLKEYLLVCGVPKEVYYDIIAKLN